MPRTLDGRRCAHGNDLYVVYDVTRWRDRNQHDEIAHRKDD